MDRLYLFLDEGGNFDFSPTGTKYFTMTCVAMKRPFSIRDSWDDYRHDLIEYGKDIEYFHCAEDNRHVRSKVFEIISNSLNSLTVDSLIVEKPRPIHHFEQTLVFTQRCWDIFFATYFNTPPTKKLLSSPIPFPTRENAKL